MAGLTASKELKQLPEFKTNLQDLFCRCSLSFQENRVRLSQRNEHKDGKIDDQSGSKV